MDTEAALEFARTWVDAWNAHDVDRVLEHFAEDAEFYSPFIVTIAKEPTGRLVGKPAIRSYWSSALARIPDLRFELIDVLVGVDSVTIYYKGHRGLVAETLFFDATGFVKMATACYSTGFGTR
jgi:ketosteroid isomerase-like protein